ncbi:unnamed protein product [Lathyrus oleraceus]
MDEYVCFFPFPHLQSVSAATGVWKWLCCYAAALSADLVGLWIALWLLFLVACRVLVSLFCRAISWPFGCWLCCYECLDGG